MAVVTELQCNLSGKEPGVRRRSPEVGTHDPLASSPGRQPVGRSLLTDENGGSAQSPLIPDWHYGSG